MYWRWHSELFTRGKTFHWVFTAVVCNFIVSWLIYDNKIFCTMLFWCSLKHSFVKLMEVLIRRLNAPWKSFYVNLNVWATCVLYCLQHSENSSAVTLLLHADWMILKNVCNQRGANSVTIAPWQTDAGRFESCISQTVLVNYLPDSTRTLNGSSIECPERNINLPSHMPIWAAKVL